MGQPKRGQRKTLPATIANKARIAQALELRKEGQTFAAIAEALAWNSPQAAYAAVKGAIDAITREPAEALVILELERLDGLWGVHYLRAQAGDCDSLSACMKVMDRRARLLGLDAPQKVEAKTEHTGGVLVTPGLLDEGAWAAAASAHQADLQKREDSVLAAVDRK